MPISPAPEASRSSAESASDAATLSDPVAASAQSFSPTSEIAVRDRRDARGEVQAMCVVHP